MYLVDVISVALMEMLIPHLIYFYFSVLGLALIVCDWLFFLNEALEISSTSSLVGVN
jgi:hypothetical protein